MDKENKFDELINANKKIAFLNQENENLAKELKVAYQKIALQNEEKEKRANELIIANEEPTFQNQEKEKRAAELLIADLKIDFLQTEEHAVFTSIVNSTDDAMISKGLDGIIRSWNHGAEKIFGYSANEIIGKSISTLIPPQLQQEEVEIIEKIKNGETFRNLKTRRVRKDGSTFHASLTISPIKNFDGNVIGASKVLSEITEKIELEKFIKKNNELARIGSWEFDLQNNTVFWSDITKEIHEVALDYIPDLETAIAFYKKGSNRTKITEYIEQAINAGKSYDDEFQIVTAKGNEKWVRSIGVAEFVNENCVRIYGSFHDIDERKIIEEQKNSLLTTLEKSLNEIFIFDAETLKFSFVNQGALINIGYSEQEIKELTPLDIKPEFSETTFNQLVNPLVTKEKEKIIFFTNHKRKNGSLYPVEIHLQFVAEGNRKRFLAVILDITERKKAEENNKRLTERLLLATKSAKLGIWDWDIKNNILKWDEGMYHLYDTNEKEFESVYDGWLTRVHPEDIESLNHRLQQALVGKEDYNPTFRLIWKDSSVHYIEASGLIERDAQGNAIRMIGANWDVTAENEKEQHLKLLETVITHTNDAVLITEAEPFDEPGPRILYVNEAFTKMTGYTSEEVIGKTPRILQGPKSNKAELKRLSEAIRRWETCEITTINYKKSGEEFWINFSVSPVANEKGWFTHWIAIERDVTAQKLVEIQLNELNKNLQYNVNKLAISNEELEQFAYVASHDLQEPLRMITSFLEKLEKKYEGILDEKGKQYIYYAVDGAVRMRQIIQDLLEFSRVGKKDEQLENIDLNGLVDEVRKLLSNQIEEKKAIFEIKKLPILTFCKSPLFQIFQNLISNALKYTKADVSPLISIACKENESNWEISVSDNGIGISEEYFDKIFILFQRLHSKNEYSGTGIGLAITKKIIEKHGGKIWVESEEGKGSSFYFTIKKQIA